MGTTTMADKDEQLAQFQSITGCDADRAQFYLESSNWQLDLAMASFYEGDGDDAGMEVGGSGVPAPAAVPTPAENVPSAYSYKKKEEGRLHFEPRRVEELNSV